MVNRSQTHLLYLPCELVASFIMYPSTLYLHTYFLCCIFSVIRSITFVLHSTIQELLCCFSSVSISNPHHHDYQRHNRKLPYRQRILLPLMPRQQSSHHNPSHAHSNVSSHLYSSHHMPPLLFQRFADPFHRTYALKRQEIYLRTKILSRFGPTNCQIGSCHDIFTTVGIGDTVRDATGDDFDRGRSAKEGRARFGCEAKATSTSG